MTHLQAANARKAEADAALNAGDYSAAAWLYTLAAHQFEKVWWDMHGERGASPDEANMRRAAREAAQKRDAAADRPRIKLEGRIGGWQS